MAVSLIMVMAPVSVRAKQYARVTLYLDEVKGGYGEKPDIKEAITGKIFCSYKGFWSFLDRSDSEYSKDISIDSTTKQISIENMSDNITRLYLNLNIPESVQQEFYLDRVEMNAGPNLVFPHKKLDRSNTKSKEAFEIEVYQGESKSYSGAGLNIDLVFKKNQATYALYNKPIINKEIEDRDENWISLWRTTDLKGVSKNFHTTVDNKQVWSEPDSYGGRRCIDRKVIENAIYEKKPFDDLEKYITEELKHRAVNGDEKLNSSFIEPLKSGKIVAKVKRLSNCEDSIHVDFGMWDTVQNKWFDGRIPNYKVEYQFLKKSKNSPIQSLNTHVGRVYYDQYFKGLLPTTNVVNEGSKISKPRLEKGKQIKIETLSGCWLCTFGGWYEDYSLEKEVEFDNKKINRDTIFYGKWDYSEKYQIKYEVDENLKNVIVLSDFFEKDAVKEKEVDEGFELESLPEVKSNSVRGIEKNEVKYTFNKWVLKKSDTSIVDRINIPYNVDQNIVLVAEFTQENIQPPQPQQPPAEPQLPPAEPEPQPQPEPDTITPPVFIEPLPIENPTVITEEETPLAETIEEEKTPLSVPTEDEDVMLEDEEVLLTEDVKIENTDIPLSDMPKTREVNYLSYLTLTALAVTGVAAILLLFGKIFKRR